MCYEIQHARSGVVLHGARPGWLKNNIKIYIKTAPTCFCAVAPSSRNALFVLTEVTVVKIVH